MGVSSLGWSEGSSSRLFFKSSDSVLISANKRVPSVSTPPSRTGVSSDSGLKISFSCSDCNSSVLIFNSGEISSIFSSVLIILLSFFSSEVVLICFKIFSIYSECGMLFLSIFSFTCLVCLFFFILVLDLIILFFVFCFEFTFTISFIYDHFFKNLFLSGL